MSTGAFADDRLLPAACSICVCAFVCAFVLHVVPPCTTLGGRQPLCMQHVCLPACVWQAASLGWDAGVRVTQCHRASQLPSKLCDLGLLHSSLASAHGVNSGL